MIIQGVDIPEDDMWFSFNVVMEVFSGDTAPSTPTKSKPVVNFREASSGSVRDLPIYLTLNPPLLNSQIQKPYPNQLRQPPRARITTTNPMFAFGSSVLGIGFGVSLIPQLTMAARALGIIENPDSFEYEIENTF
tara:strand:+ start:102 stop:506 length:405 start_codon:yes stop_codon:yes gene_type:complete